MVQKQSRRKQCQFLVLSSQGSLLLCSCPEQFQKDAFVYRSGEVCKEGTGLGWGERALGRGGSRKITELHSHLGEKDPKLTPWQQGRRQREFLKVTYETVLSWTSLKWRGEKHCYGVNTQGRLYFQKQVKISIQQGLDKHRGPGQYFQPEVPFRCVVHGLWPSVPVTFFLFASSHSACVSQVSNASTTGE